MLFKPFLLGVLIAFAASAPSADAAKSRKKPLAPPVPLMWKISDADNHLYLLGSFHMLKPNDYPLSADVDAAFDDAEALVFELPPEEVLSPQLGLAMGQAALRRNGTPLNSDLPDATVTRLEAWVNDNSAVLQTMGLPAEALQRFEPWFVGLTISVIEMNKIGLDPKIGLDMHFIELASRASKPTTGLETGSEQIAVFQTMSKDEQLQFLEESMSEAEGAQAELEKLHDAWRRGDQSLLWDGMARSMRHDYPKLYQRINVARNDAWVPRLQRMLDDESQDDTLVVVGALHLLGEDGVVEKLRAKGYRVERICSACVRHHAVP
jgi:uncharacterized protein